MDIFSLIMIVVGAFWMGWNSREKHAEKQVNKLFDRAEEELQKLEKQADKNTIVVKIEKHGDIFYLFNEETDEFIAQGKSMDEIREFVQRKYLGKKTIMVPREYLDEAGLK